MQRLQPGEIEIAPVDDYDRTRGPVNQVESIGVVHLASGDMDEYGNGTTQFVDGVSLDRRLGRSKTRPRKKSPTQVDGSRVQRIGQFLEAQADVRALIQFDRHGNQSVTECFERPPVPSVVGIRQRGAGHLAATPGVIELGALRIQRSHQVAQTLAASQLRIGDANEMVPGREVPDAVVRPESIDQMFAVSEWPKPQQLRENRLVMIHDLASSAKKTGNDTGQKPLAISNRRNQRSNQSPPSLLDCS